MSNFLAIATVTATLNQIVSTAVQDDVPGADVTMLELNAAGNNIPSTRTNVYLYQVTPNTGWTNADLPARNSNGQLVQRPQAALNLHYLLSFYGDDAQLEPQRMLGSVIRTLHAQPILTRQQIQKTVTTAPFNTFLAKSNLADSVELVKFTPLALSLEELAKIWSVFFQTPYRLSAAYQGTVVLIESDDAPQQALPVRARNLYVLPFQQPVIEQILSQTAPGAPIVADQPILAGYIVVLVGRQLKGDVTFVKIGDTETAPSVDNISNTQISIQLPTSLQSGVQAVQVVQQLLMGTPLVAHRGVESNVAAFVLHPTITPPVSCRVVNGTRLPTHDLTVTVNPAVGKRQRVILLLNELNPPATRPARAYSFNAPARNQPTDPDQTTSITIRTVDVVPGNYLVRVQVDGAESPLAVNASGQYASPQVTI